MPHLGALSGSGEPISRLGFGPRRCDRTGCRGNDRSPERIPADLERSESQHAPRSLPAPVATLFRPQCRDRIDARRAVRRQDSRRDRHRDQHQRGDAERERIEGRDTVQLAGNKTRGAGTDRCTCTRGGRIPSEWYCRWALFALLSIYQAVEISQAKSREIARSTGLKSLLHERSAPSMSFGHGRQSCFVSAI